MFQLVTVTIFVSFKISFRHVTFIAYDVTIGAGSRTLKGRNIVYKSAGIVKCS